MANKINFSLTLCLIVLILSGCKESKTESKFELSNYSFEQVSDQDNTLTVDVTSSSSWSAQSSANWCILAPRQGVENQMLTIFVNANLSTSPREAKITVESNGAKKTVTITQKAAQQAGVEYHYNLPVVFHVLYKDRNDPLQYVPEQRLTEILSTINKLYKDQVNSVDMNLTFTLATTDPNGRAMSTQGVNYVQMSNNYPIAPGTFMSDNINKGGVGYVKYIWDPNRYINVMIYNFTIDKLSQSTVLGISHLPFTTKDSHTLAGLNPVDYSHLELENLSFPYCLSINSRYINDQSTPNEYSTSDINVTLAHELGHYLGLYHVFAENSDGTISNSSTDSDYCKDTPSYNKVKYDIYYLDLATNDRPNFTFDNLVKRQDGAGNGFTSYNIMDYAVSYSNQLTKEQRIRIRHVLRYSPLIPGPKMSKTAYSKASTSGYLDLPIAVIK